MDESYVFKRGDLILEGIADVDDGKSRGSPGIWENFNQKALAFLRLASIRLMLRKLCNPA